MWYPTHPENQQITSPGKAKAGQESDSFGDQHATATDLEEASAAAAPGSEYWLP